MGNVIKMKNILLPLLFVSISITSFSQCNLEPPMFINNEIILCGYEDRDAFLEEIMFMSNLVWYDENGNETIPFGGGDVITGYGDIEEYNYWVATREGDCESERVSLTFLQYNMNPPSGGTISICEGSDSIYVPELCHDTWDLNWSIMGIEFQDGCETDLMGLFQDITFADIYYSKDGCVSARAEVMFETIEIGIPTLYAPDQLCAEDNTIMPIQSGAVNSEQIHWIISDSVTFEGLTYNFPLDRAGTYRIELYASNGSCSSLSYYDSIIVSEVQKPILLAPKYSELGELITFEALPELNSIIHYYNSDSRGISVGSVYSSTLEEDSLTLCVRTELYGCYSDTACKTTYAATGYPILTNPIQRLAKEDIIVPFAIQEFNPVHIQWKNSSGEILSTSKTFTPNETEVDLYEYFVYFSFDSLEFKPLGRAILEIISGIQGTVFEDTNENGILDNGEKGIARSMIKLLPDSRYTLTDNNGNFFFNCTEGEYSIHATEAFPYYLSNPEPVTVHVSSNELQEVVVPMRNNDGFSDLSVIASDQRARPGFDTRVWLNYENTGSTAQTVELSLSHSSSLSLLEAQPEPSFIVDSMLIWQLDSLEHNETGRVTIDFNLVADIDLLGTTLQYVSEITSKSIDFNLSNDIYILEREITGSYDPNDKQVSPSFKEEGYVLMDTALEYTIRYQNEGTDTAFTVRVVDTLNANLDISTFTTLATSHDYELELNDRIVTWTFNNILLVDKTTNEPASHGFIKFSISPLANLPENTTVTNKADIFFDFNPTVETKTVSSVYVTELPQESIQTRVTTEQSLEVHPNPASEYITIELPIQQTCNLIIYNENGQIVQSLANIEGTSCTINIKDFPSGSYIYSVVSMYGKEYNGIFVK